MQPLAAFTNLKENLALNNVEPFFLLQVEMQGWSALDEVGVFNDEHAIAGFAGQDLEEDGTVSTRVRFSEAVFACGNNVDFVREISIPLRTNPQSGARCGD